jgi:hypothetical protein
MKLHSNFATILVAVSVCVFAGCGGGANEQLSTIDADRGPAIEGPESLEPSQPELNPERDGQPQPLPSGSPQPAPCPKVPGYTDKNCMLHYTLPAILSPDLGKSFILLGDAQTGSVEKRCVPSLARFTEKLGNGKIRQARCKEASIEAVRDVLNAGNSSKLFCQKTAEKTYELYGMRDLRRHVIEELKRLHPEMCD